MLATIGKNNKGTSNVKFVPSKQCIFIKIIFIASFPKGQFFETAGCSHFFLKVNLVFLATD